MCGRASEPASLPKLSISIRLSRFFIAQTRSYVVLVHVIHSLDVPTRTSLQIRTHHFLLFDPALELAEEAA